MKKIAFYALVLVCFSTANAELVQAQTVGLRVDVPFNFNVAEKVLPAGQYLILAPQGGTLRISGPNGSAAVAMTNQISGARPLGGAGAIVFNCYGSRCFLSQFWTARSEVGQEMPKSRPEKDLESEKQQLAVVTLKAKATQN